MSEREMGQLASPLFHIRYSIMLLEQNEPDVIAAIRADEAAKVRAECVRTADEYNAPDSSKASDGWWAELMLSEVYNAGATDAAMQIATAIRALGEKPQS